MTLIDGDRIITAQLYDDEHEEFTEKKMSIIDYINAYTDEGVTEADVVEQIKWIPCNERLPEFGVKVLAYVKNKDPEGRFNNDGVYTAELKDKVPMHDPEGKKNIWGIPGYDSEWTVWAWSYFTEPNVLAWMPLPEPYQEADHDE